MELGGLDELRGGFGLLEGGEVVVGDRLLLWTSIVKLTIRYFNLVVLVIYIVIVRIRLAG